MSSPPGPAGWPSGAGDDGARGRAQAQDAVDDLRAHHDHARRGGLSVGDERATLVGRHGPAIADLSAALGIERGAVQHQLDVGALEGLLDATGKPAAPDSIRPQAEEFLAGILAAEERQFPSVGHGTDYRYKASALAGTVLVHADEVMGIEEGVVVDIEDQG